MKYLNTRPIHHYIERGKPHFIKSWLFQNFILAGGQGFEPWITGPEPVVLPLYYPPAKVKNLAISIRKSRKNHVSLRRHGGHRANFSLIVDNKCPSRNCLFLDGHLLIHHLPASYQVVFAGFMEADLLSPAAFLNQGAPPLELAARGRVKGSRYVSLKGWYPAAYSRL